MFSLINMNSVVNNRGNYTVLHCTTAAVVPYIVIGMVK